jgi:hypothetical protein
VEQDELEEIEVSDVRGYFDPWYPFHNEISSYQSFRFPNIRLPFLSALQIIERISLPEEELTIQIRNINGVHINHVNIPESS